MYNIAKIFELLKERKLEQKDLAKGIGASAGNVTEWKKGRNKPSDKVMIKIADYFQLPISEFYIYDNLAPSNKKDSLNEIEKSYEYIELEKLLDDLDEEQLKVLLATAKALNKKRET